MQSVESHEARRGRRRAWSILALAASGGALALGCGSSAAPGSGDASPDAGPTPSTHDDSGAPTLDAARDAATGGDGGYPAGWLYTSGNRILMSTGGGGGAPWMGRGVNVDDVFLCGYNNSLWMTSPDQTLESIVSGLMTDWKPNFVRMSLAMDSYGTVAGWTSSDSQYQKPMTAVIHAIGSHPNVYVLVTLRSDASMIERDTADGDPEATGIPSDGTNTPDATAYPSGTDATYVALVDSFANDRFVLFGLTNEPGGNKQSNATLGAAMNHAVGVIRAEEDRLGVPHHIVSVQGNGWTSDISFYAASPAPIQHDNVVYEVHGYPPSTSSYTYSSIPVIVGEYGSLASGTSDAFFADLEAKQIPNLAWDFEPFSDCAPDLVNVTHSASGIVASSWGSVVQSYLVSHAAP